MSMSMSDDILDILDKLGELEKIIRIVMGNQNG